MRVETPAGVKTIALRLGQDGKVAEATVDMGEPILDGERIPVRIKAPRVLNAPLIVAGKTWSMTCVSMGNPHAVIYVDDVAAVPLEQVGPLIESHELFPQRVNVHFVRARSKAEADMRTWERGSGVTLACGTGASAVCVAGVLSGRTDRALLAHLSGGDLRLEWRESDNHVYMTGPAVEVFSGDWLG
jgi:diaminopimelate epimerase